MRQPWSCHGNNFHPFGVSPLLMLSLKCLKFQEDLRFPLHLNIHYVIYAFPDFTRSPE